MSALESIRARFPFFIVSLLTALLAVAAAPDATASGERRLDRGPRAVPRESQVELKDDLEAAKIASTDPTLLWFRNGVHLRPAIGMEVAEEELAGIRVLQFSGRVLPEWLAALTDLRIEVLDHVQNHAMLVRIPAGAADGVAGLIAEGVVRYVGRFPAEAKISAAFDLEASGEVQVTVLLFAPPNTAEREQLEKLIQVDQQAAEPLPYFRGRLVAASLPDVASLEWVKWIEPYEPGHLHNLEAGMSGAADDVVSLGVFDGTGVRVAVDDSGISRTGSTTECGGSGAAYHSDIASSRIVDEWDFYNADANACDDDSHGTHTAGTIGGDGTLLPTYAGIAPDVTFQIYKDCCNAAGAGFGHFDSVISRAATHDADIIANSWGGGAAGGYNINSQWADQAVRGVWNGSDGSPQYMFLTVSTGNERDLATSPATGKNVVAVGATKDGNAPDAGWCWGVNVCDSSAGCSCTDMPRCGDRYWPADETICFSNHGPIDSDGDGHTRIKPDVVAPGTRIMSLAAPHLMTNPGQYRFSDGTSMAQPVVAGVVALMLEAYPENRNWPEKTKARLLGTAMDMGDKSLFGHGMVDALHAVFSSETMSTALWEGDSISGSGAEADWNFTVPAGFSEVRVYLAWTDVDSATTEVVNDLDLRVYDGLGTLVGSSAAYDDTVEYVRMTTGVPGTWVANVRGYDVPQPNAFYGLYAGVVTTPSSLSMDADPNTVCVKPGTSFTVDAALSNAGHSVPASESRIDLPDSGGDILMHNVEVVAADPTRSHIYQEAAIRRDVPSNTYSTYLGAVHKSVTREARWTMQVSPTAPEGSYMLIPAGTAVGHIYYGDVVDVEVDATNPTSVTNLVSSTHPAGTCWKQTYVWMNWTPATDTACGLDGYGLEWSSGGPALPPAVKSLEESTTVYYESLAESTTPYYFNLRSLDNAGNWAPGYASYGPFWVDATPPGAVMNLASESHPPGVCTDNPEVAMFWEHAADDNCGVDGYSVSWTAGLPGLPDEIPELGLEDQQFSILSPSNAPLYYNIRARDAGDNWSGAYVSHGPIWVDTIPGEMEGLSVERGGDDLFFYWVGVPEADHYRLYEDTDPRFTSPTQVNDDVQIPELLDVGGVQRPGRIVYFRVMGTNICGAAGPL